MIKKRLDKDPADRVRQADSRSSDESKFEERMSQRVRTRDNAVSQPRGSIFVYLLLGTKPRRTSLIVKW